MEFGDIIHPTVWYHAFLQRFLIFNTYNNKGIDLKHSHKSLLPILYFNPIITGMMVLIPEIKAQKYSEYKGLLKKTGLINTLRLKC